MRLCDSYKHCDDCPVDQAGFSCDCDHQGYSKTGAAELEHIIMAWAADHPEPVYPTWAEWLVAQDIITEYGRIECVGSGTCGIFTDKGESPIPADIASKLGIQPKEAKE
jgi:hypothetical protein